MDNHHVSAEDISNLTMQEAQRLLDVLMPEADAISAQLRAATAHQLATGEYADPVWFSRATNAMKAKRRTIMRIQQHQKQLKRSMYEREEVSKSIHSYECCFVKMAQTLLTDDMFEQIAEGARAMSIAESTI